MIKITPSTPQDLEQIAEWIEADPYHKGLFKPFWWITGNGLLSYCLLDSKGPLMYVRLDAEKDLMRIYTQFGPETEVSRIRTAKGIMWALPKMEPFAREQNLKGFIFQTKNPSLASFMQIKFGFTPTGSNDDYWKPFEEA